MSFLEKARGGSGVPHGAPGSLAGSWEPTALAAAALKAECELIRTAGEGSRNDTLNRAAFNLVQLVMGGQISEHEVKVALIDAAHGAGLSPREINRTIDSGWRKGAHRARTPEPRESAPALTVLDGPYAASTPVQPSESRRIVWADLAADEHVQEWLCEPLIPAGALVSLYSPPKVGKSLLALEVAIAISRGDVALGVQCKQTRVLYLDYENGRYEVRARISNMGNPELLGLDDLAYEEYPLLPALDTPQGGLELLAMAQEFDAGLVVIDTVSRTVSGDENDAKTWLALYRCSLLPLKRAGIAVLRLDHTGKDETKGQRGSSAKRGDVDLVWRLAVVVENESYALICEDHRMQLAEEKLHLRREPSPLSHRVDTRSMGQVKLQAILDACDKAGLALSSGRDQIRKAAEADGLKCSTDLLAHAARVRQGRELPDLT